MDDFKTLLAIGSITDKNVVALDRAVTVEVGAKEMLKNNASSLLILSSEEKVIGIVTEGDIVRRGVAEGHDLANKKLEDIMTPDPVSLNSDESIFEARKIMTSKNLSHLVVLDNGEPIGILTSKNVIGSA